MNREGLSWVEGVGSGKKPVTDFGRTGSLGLRPGPKQDSRSP